MVVTQFDVLFKPMVQTLTKGQRFDLNRLIPLSAVGHGSVPGGVREQLHTLSYSFFFAEGLFVFGGVEHGFLCLKASQDFVVFDVDLPVSLFHKLRLVPSHFEKKAVFLEDALAVTDCLSFEVETCFFNSVSLRIPIRVEA